jgi:hypothetical protein
MLLPTVQLAQATAAGRTGSNGRKEL